MQEGTWKKPETLMRYLRRGGATVGANSRPHGFMRLNF